MSVRMKMKTPFEDGIADMLYYHPKVKTSKGHDHFTIQIRQDLNNSVIFTTKHAFTFTLNFIMSLHLTSGMHETFYIFVFTSQKKYKRSDNLSHRHLQISNTRTMKARLSVEISQRQSSFLHQPLK